MLVTVSSSAKRRYMVRGASISLEDNLQFDVSYCNCVRGTEWSASIYDRVCTLAFYVAPEKILDLSVRVADLPTTSNTF